MIARNNSIANTLDGIISKVETEIELEQKRAHSYSACRAETRNRLSSLDSLEDVNCRICYDPNPEMPVIYPCKCKGTMGAIHLKCLERWLEESNRNDCELCGYEFRVERTPCHKVVRSIIIWLCLTVSENEHDTHARSVKADLLRCLIVTPMTIACSYICVIAADFYATNNYDNFPPARWTTYSLLSMMALLILSCFIWIYMALQYHQKAWFYWWQKTSIVKILHITAERTALMRNVSQV